MVELTGKKYPKKEMLTSGKIAPKIINFAPQKWGEVNRKFSQTLKGVGI